MRLIGTFETEKEAYQFYSFLLKEGIQNVYEPFQDPEKQKKRYRIWISDEDDLNRALEWLSEYQQNPKAAAFQNVQIPLAALPPSTENPAQRVEEEELPPLPPRIRRRRFQMVLTQCVISLCVFLFLWNDFQEAEMLQAQGAIALQIAFTPVQQALLFDYPASFKPIEELLANYSLKDFKEIKDLPAGAKALLEQAENTPSWKGIYPFFQSEKKQGWEKAKQVPLFEKIRQGQVWRLFTPCLLHRDFLHILFNMAWAWILGKQIEERVRRWKILLLIAVIGVVSNTVQYLISGPYFLGYSGVVVGLAGFIWMRQKMAPWEGYPLSKGTILFLLFFVLAMFILELLTFGLQLFSVVNLSANIANAAHIVGGLCGIALGRLSFFSRSKP
jgi:GlpG protein